jgi:hypothetical protein
MTEWAKVTIAFMKWGYTMPRTMAVEGRGRPDLARQLSAEDIDGGVVDVFIDPETLMPMPRSLRLFLLNDMVNRGLVSPQEYRRRLPFAFVKDLSTPDEDHQARAKRVAEAIRQTGDPQVLPILWQDDEAIHQDVLERELILPDDGDPMVRQAAQMRWQMLAQQAQMKQMGMMMAMGGGAPPGEGGDKPGESDGPGADQQPTLAMGGNSPVPMTGEQVDMAGGKPDELQGARQFDQMTAGY